MSKARSLQVDVDVLPPFCFWLIIMFPINLNISLFKYQWKVTLWKLCEILFSDTGNVYPNIALFRNMYRCSYIILPAALYGCETWSVTLREEHRLRVFENRVLRKIFGPKREKVTGGWRKIHIEALHYLYSSTNIIRMIKSKWSRCEGHVARVGRGNMHSGSLWWGNAKEKCHLEDLSVDGRVILR